MLERMDAAELSEWMAYERIETIDNQRIEMLLATQALMTANANRDTKKRPRPFGIQDVAPWMTPPPRAEQTEEQQVAAAQLATKLLNNAPRRG